MTCPRAHLVDPNQPRHYHVVSRCVRRAFLFGRDRRSKRDYSYRRQWILKRMEQLAPSYALEINAYAIMSNHFHLAVYLDPPVAKGWSDEEVADRWLAAYPPKVKPELLESTILSLKAAMLADEALLTQRRADLGSLSHFMKNLKQPIARWANKEDGVTGHFFEGRFFSGALVSHEAVICCLAYIDLNPIRAGEARSLKECELTSIMRRIAQAKKHEANARLMPILSGLGRSKGVDFGLDAYQELLQDYVQAQHTKDPPPNVWRDRIDLFQHRQRVYGSEQDLKDWAQSINQTRIWGRPLP